MALALIETVIGRARRRSCALLGLNTNEGNEAALSLYRRLGFAAERAQWKGSRQLWLEKRIEPPQGRAERQWIGVRPSPRSRRVWTGV
jgi:hypothetical protein